MPDLARLLLDLDQVRRFFSAGRWALTPQAILDGCGFFARVRGPARDRLLGMARVRRLARGERAFNEGSACPGVFIVGTGLVRVYRVSALGKEHVLHLVPPGRTFAEVAAIGGLPCPAFAEALEETLCLVLPSADFRQALEDDHELCLQLMASMAGWVKRFVDLLEGLALHDASSRLARWLLEAAGPDSDLVDLPGRKKDLASHLNLTSETLSRTLRRLGEAGLVTTVQRRLRIEDRDGLGDLADGL